MNQEKYTWKKEYSFVLIANVLYCIAFYFITNYFTKGKKEETQLTGETKDLLFNYNTSMFIDIKGVLDLLGEDAKKGSMAMFTEIAEKNFSKIITS